MHKVLVWDIQSDWFLMFIVNVMSYQGVGVGVDRIRGSEHMLGILDLDKSVKKTLRCEFSDKNRRDRKLGGMVSHNCSISQQP